jgi:hypothetical protein
MAYIRKIRRALLQHYRPILESKSLEEAQIQTMFLDASPVTKVVKQLWFDIAPMEAERMWLHMQRQTGIKSLGRHSRYWLGLVEEFLNAVGLDKLTTELTNTTKNWVLKKILEATAQGNGIDWLVREMEGNFTRKRARVIARTETTRARNSGYLTAGKELPYEAVKVWNSAQDPRTRNDKHADHLHLNGVTAEINEYFRDPRSGALMMFPGDSSNATVKGADTINCRCRCTFLAKEDANGLPIMKAILISNSAVIAV